MKELEEEIDKLPQEKVKPTRLLRSQQAAAPPPTAAGEEAEEEEDEQDGKEIDMTHSFIINALCVCVRACVCEGMCV